MTSFHAWVDESGSNRERDPNTYILAAAICPVDSVEHVRSQMRPLRVKGTPKLHWRDETKPSRRRAITQVVADCTDVVHLVVVRVGVTAETRRRPRQIALVELLTQLDQRGVGRAVFESRGRADDERDVEVLRSLRDRHRAISTRLRIDHTPGRFDAGLWIPDVVCGAVVASRSGDTSYYELLSQRTVIVTIDHVGRSHVP